MNPADPQQFANIGKAIEPFYRIVNNADGILMGDADPGGWPQSPSEQVKLLKPGPEKNVERIQHSRRKSQAGGFHVDRVGTAQVLSL